MTNSSFYAWRSSSTTSLAVAEKGMFTSTSVIVSSCEHTNGILSWVQRLSSATRQRSGFKTGRKLLQSLPWKHIQQTLRRCYIRQQHPTTDQAARCGAVEKMNGLCRQSSVSGWAIFESTMSSLLLLGTFCCPCSAQIAWVSMCRTVLQSARAESVEAKDINISGTEAWISSPDAPWLMQVPPSMPYLGCCQTSCAERSCVAHGNARTAPEKCHRRPSNTSTVTRHMVHLWAAS